MKKGLIIVFLLFSGISYSQQRQITGVVKVKFEEIPLPGAYVEVKGTDIKTQTDFDGNFTIIVPDSLSTLEIGFIGYETLEYELGVENHIEILIEEYFVPPSYWLTVATDYDVLNTEFGFSISNGADEQPLIHFEDFSSDFLYKIRGQTDFKSDYSYSTELFWSYPFGRLYQTSIKYSQTDFNSIDFFKRDVNLSAQIGVGFGQVLTKAGYRELNKYTNFGAEIGFQKSHIGVYYGFLTGYYSDYWTYSVFLQSFIFKSRLGLRIVYDRIEDFDFLNLGLRYTFRN